MSIQTIPEKTEPPTVIKNEPLESEIVEIGSDQISSEEIGMDGIIDSKEEIPDIKDIVIAWHPLCEDSIKSETVPENICESKHSESLETEVFVKTENAPFIKVENITESKNLNKTEDVSDRNGQELVQVQVSNEHFNTLNNLGTNKHLSIRRRKAKHPQKNDFVKSYRTCKTTSWEKDKGKIKVIKAPVIPVEPHEYISLAKDKHVCNHCQQACINLSSLKVHIMKIHREVTTMYLCPYCPYKSKWSLQGHIIQKHKDTKDIQWFQCHLCEMKFKLKSLLITHTNVHLTREQIQDRLKLCLICGKGFIKENSLRNHIKFVHNKEQRDVRTVKRKCQECEYTTTNSQLLKHHIKITHKNYEKRYHCDKCGFRTDNDYSFKTHKLIHLKPEATHYFYCYHCSYQSKYKGALKIHILRHFEDEEVKFHCYICNFMTLKREAIVEHIKKHSNVQIKSEINEGN